MGLDMELRLVSKPHLNRDVVYTGDDLPGDIMAIPNDEIGLPMYVELRPYVQKIRFMNECWDMDKLRRDCGLPRDAFVTMRSSLGVDFYDPVSHSTVWISDDDMKTKYTVRNEETRYAFRTREVRYWRKAYDVQEWFYEQLDRLVENCGFYRLSNEDLEQFNLRWNDTVDDDLDDESAIYYWEWY